MRIIKHKNLYKSLLLTVVFLLLAFSITKNIIDIYASSSARQTVCVPIMMYHQVKNSDYGKDVISPYEFECDLQYLKENNYTTISMTDLIDFVYNGKELPAKPVILSIDDGHLSVYRYVFPLLKKYNMKVVLSIIGKGVDDFSKVKDEHMSYAHITWDQVYEMEQSGLVEIQNHSYNLHRICNGRYGCGQKSNESFEQYEVIITEDIAKLQDEITSITNKTPNTFAYPYGRYNDNTEIILKELGFQATLTVKYGVNLITRDHPDSLYNLKRICRSHNKSIKKLLQDGMDTLKYIE